MPQSCKELHKFIKTSEQLNINLDQVHEYAIHKRESNYQWPKSTHE